MSQQSPREPGWFLGLYGFVTGIGVGALATTALFVTNVIPPSPLWRSLVLPILISVPMFLVLGVLGIINETKRHRRVQRDLRSGRDAP